MMNFDPILVFKIDLCPCAGAHPPLCLEASQGEQVNPSWLLALVFVALYSVISRALGCRQTNSD